VASGVNATRNGLTSREFYLTLRQRRLCIPPIKHVGVQNWGIMFHAIRKTHLKTMCYAFTVDSFLGTKLTFINIRVAPKNVGSQPNIERSLANTLRQ